VTRRLHFGYTLGTLLVGAVTIASIWTDAHRYFGDQMHDSSVFAEHSADATFAGRALAELPPETRVLMDQRLIGQPTVQFLAPNTPKPEGYAPYLLPLTTGNDTAVFLSGDETPDADLLRQLYPHAVIRTFAPPTGDPVLLREALITRDDVTAIQGLEATLQPSDGGAPVEMRVTSVDLRADQMPLAAPFEASFEGSLDAPTFGDYVLAVEGPQSFDLRLDDQVVASNEQAVQVTLPRGIHHLALSANISDASQDVRLLWRPPASGQLMAIPQSNLFASPTVGSGLVGHYFGNGTWTGPSVFEQLDPFIAMYFQVAPLPLPFSVEWVGQLAVPAEGAYGFDTTSLDSSQVFIDEHDIPKHSQVTLTSGWHAIRVRYEAHSGFSHVELRWQPPGQDWSIVPSTFLAPNASVGGVAPLPQLPVRNAPPGQTDTTARGGGLLTPVWQFEPGAGSRPVGVAVDSDGDVYVVDGERNRVFKLDIDGHLLWTADPPAGTPGFEQLSAVAVSPDGGALVLDGESGVISRFEPSGEYAGVFARDISVYHPRGIAVGPNGDVYLADTGGGRALHLTPDGKQVGQIGGKNSADGELSQPTGVAVTSEGDVVLVDPAAKKVIHFAASGAMLGVWDFSSGPTLNGPQLALDSHGTIWVTDTNSGRLEAFSVDDTAQSNYQPDGGLANPSGVAAGDGYVVVAEPGAGRVRKFTLPERVSAPGA
jgi:DNA-binding beta-propeller fold protein YncE